MKLFRPSAIVSTMILSAMILPTACTIQTEAPKVTTPTFSEPDVKTTDETDSTIEKARDIISGGGQPGAISISGPLAEEVNGHIHISVRQSTGRGIRSTNPELDRAQLIKSKDLSPENLKLIENAKTLKNIIYFGCEILDGTTSLVPAGNLTPSKFKPSPSEKITMLQANTVVICGYGDFTPGLISVVAEKVYLSNLRLDLTGGPEMSFSVVAKDLILAHRSIIRTKAPNGPSTVVSGPSVSISALRIGDTEGGEAKAGTDDRIEIQAEGADYEAEKK